MTALWRRFRWWLRGRRKEDEVREELAFHLAREVEERRACGLSEADARRAAERDLGNEARVREEARAVWTWRPLDEFVLTSISGRTYRTSDGSVEARIFPYPAFERLREVSAPYLSSMFMVFRGGRMNVLIDGQAELTDAQYVSGDFCRGLAIPPGAGRLLVADDDRPDAEPVAVVSAGYAARRFGSLLLTRQIRTIRQPVARSHIRI